MLSIPWLLSFLTSSLPITLSSTYLGHSLPWSLPLDFVNVNNCYVIFTFSISPYDHHLIYFMLIPQDPHFNLSVPSASIIYQPFFFTVPPSFPYNLTISMSLSPYSVKILWVGIRITPLDLYLTSTPSLILIHQQDKTRLNSSLHLFHT